jgi:hypothetical protein
VGTLLQNDVMSSREGEGLNEGRSEKEGREGDVT